MMRNSNIARPLALAVGGAILMLTLVPAPASALPLAAERYDVTGDPSKICVNGNCFYFVERVPAPFSVAEHGEAGVNMICSVNPCSYDPYANGNSTVNVDGVGHTDY